MGEGKWRQVVVDREGEKKKLEEKFSKQEMFLQSIGKQVNSRI